MNTAQSPSLNINNDVEVIRDFFVDLKFNDNFKRTESQQIRQKTRPIPFSQREPFRKLFEEQLDAKIIRKSIIHNISSQKTRWKYSDYN